MRDGADAVLQTSDDGWTCGTPLSALTDDRPAMLAVAMNGKPLPIEHGFPVRTIVPGLYGYVSACKWVVDLEVTRFDRNRGLLDLAGLGRARARSSCPRASTSRLGRRGRRRRVPASAASPGRSTPASRRSSSPSTAAPGSPPTLARTPTDDAWVQWTGDASTSPRATTSCGSAPPTRTGSCRPASCATCCPTAPPAGTRSTSPPRRPADGGEPGRRPGRAAPRRHLDARWGAAANPCRRRLVR